MPNSKIWDACDKKIVDFMSAQSWAILPGTEFVALWRQFVCSGFFYTLLLRRNSEVKKMSSGFESDSFASNAISSSPSVCLLPFGDVGLIFDTQTDVTCWCHVTFWPRDSNAIFEGKIA